MDAVLCRQRDYLEKTVADLRAQLKHEAQTNSKRTTTALQVRPSLVGQHRDRLGQTTASSFQSKDLQGEGWLLSNAQARMGTLLMEATCMQENKMLIQEISTLREQLRDLKKQLIMDGSGTPKSKARPARAASTVTRLLSKNNSYTSEE